MHMKFSPSIPLSTSTRRRDCTLRETLLLVLNKSSVQSRASFHEQFNLSLKPEFQQSGLTLRNSPQIYYRKMVPVRKSAIRKMQKRRSIDDRRIGRGEWNERQFQ